MGNTGIIFWFIFCWILVNPVNGQTPNLEPYNPVWLSQSLNSAESMPLGGGDIGMNVWVENGDLYFYFSRSGTFDDHNTFLKMGRVKLRLDPNPFENPEKFSQELLLQDGFIRIQGKDGELKKLRVFPSSRERDIIHLFGMEMEEKKALNLAPGENNEEIN